VFVFQWEYYSQRPGEIIRIWEGGIAIQGALLAGMLTLIVYCWRKSRSFWELADALVLALPLGQAIGRWGNFFNQELYGKPTGLPWGIYIDPANRIPGFETLSRFHPAFFYESILNAVLFAILLRMSKKGKREGSLFAGYLAGYGSIRFLVDFVRIDPMPMLMGLRYSQIISIILIAGATALYVRNAYVLPKSG
jgi:phosphatidylglycerol:prolipoprotein diacylglycerol transferase